MEHAHANLVQFFIHNFKISLRLQKDAELFNEIPVVDVVDNHPFVHDYILLLSLAPGCLPKLVYTKHPVHWSILLLHILQQ